MLSVKLVSIVYLVVITMSADTGLVVISEN